jgi:hypothetical protein
VGDPGPKRRPLPAFHRTRSARSARRRSAKKIRRSASEVRYGTSADRRSNHPFRATPEIATRKRPPSAVGPAGVLRAAPSTFPTTARERFECCALSLPARYAESAGEAKAIGLAPTSWAVLVPPARSALGASRSCSRRLRAIGSKDARRARRLGDGLEVGEAGALDATPRVGPSWPFSTLPWLWHGRGRPHLLPGWVVHVRSKGWGVVGFGSP